MLAFYLSLLETDEDRALFEFYFHQHEQSVLKIVMKLLRNQAMAEDAVQNGWVNLIKISKSLCNFRCKKGTATLLV